MEEDNGRERVQRGANVPLSANAMTQSKILLGWYSCDGYRLTEDKGLFALRLAR